MINSDLSKRASQQNHRNDDFAASDRMPRGWREIAMAPTPQAVFGKFGEHAVASMLVNSVAVWVNEGGAGGEVVR
jgi:carbamate kinase